MVILWAWWAGLGSRRARSRALLARLTKATMACQPLLLNQICGRVRVKGSACWGQTYAQQRQPTTPSSQLEALLSVQTKSPSCEIVQDAVKGPAQLGAQQCPQLLHRAAHLKPRGQARVSAPQGETPIPVRQWRRGS